MRRVCFYASSSWRCRSLTAVVGIGLATWGALVPAGAQNETSPTQQPVAIDLCADSVVSSQTGTPSAFTLLDWRVCRRGELRAYRSGSVERTAVAPPIGVEVIALQRFSALCQVRS